MTRAHMNAEMAIGPDKVDDLYALLSSNGYLQTGPSSAGAPWHARRDDAPVHVPPREMPILDLLHNGIALVTRTPGFVVMAR